MILPIVAYGDPVLKKVGVDIDENYPELDKLIDNMRETMANAHGVGLAAPQIGLSIRLFLVDARPFADDEDLEEEERAFLANYNKVFINAQIVEEEGDEWAFSEGCLSIPNVREDVFRKDTIVVEYLDENFQKHTEKLTGLAARVFQHEYDHIDGILFTDHLTSLKKRLIKKKLENIAKGKITPEYRMRFPKLKRK
ncbi:peptide deformylase [Aureivirga sp. CE67]|uniref:peptide deformylase n=1 Tax=Aureivirga sp. CE67 TaxID=1788983 RepID=UPI0018CB6A87|nr:peptide deformylase [Aureivirga sp. CE67]